MQTLVVLQADEYKKTIQHHPQKKLVNLKTFIPSLQFDIRYATTNNFLRKKLYTKVAAYLRKPVAEALMRAQAQFEKSGVGILVYDAYRPYSVTQEMFRLYPDETYVASPAKGSRHNRGCAVDMGLIELKTRKVLKMPTEYDSFKKEAWPSTPTLDAEANKNKQLIISIMEANGFKVNASEWWHFDFVGWNQYELLNVSFDFLENEK